MIYVAVGRKGREADTGPRRGGIGFCIFVLTVKNEDERSDS